MADDIATLNERVKSKLRFSAEDVIANRERRLTDDQWVLVRSKQRAYVRKGTIGLVVMWAIFTVLMIVAVVAQGAKPQDLRVLPYALGFNTLMFGAVGVGGRIYARDLVSGKISSADGRAVTKKVKYQARYGSGFNYELRIGRRKFLMNSERDLKAFETGVLYRVYYVRYAPLHIILSAEALGDRVGK
jgi:hypothetical protein